MKVRLRRHVACLAPSLAAVLAMGCTEHRPQIDAGGPAVRDSGLDAEVGPDAPEAGPPWPIHDVAYRLHEEIESIVYVRWEQDIAATSLVQYRVGDEPWRETPSGQRAAGTHEQIVLGIPYDSDFQFRVVATAEGPSHLGALVAGTTGPTPETIVVPELFVFDDAAFEPTGKYLFGSITVDEGRWAPAGGFWSFIVDRRGRLVWARLTPYQHCTMYVRVSTNGRDLLIDDNTFWFNFDASLSRILRIKIDGSIVQAYDTPGLHHPFTELPDGTIAWGATHPPYGETLEELAPDGGRWTIWNSEVFLARADPRTDERTFQSNALFWDESTETYLFSSYQGFYVLQIARADGAVPRILGGGLPEAWHFAPEQAAFYWQHGVAFTEDRTLLLSMHESDTSFEGVVREYRLDDPAKTLVQVWSWGDGNGVEPIFAGEAHRLANGDTLINYGTSPVVREVTREGDIVWEIRWNVPHFVGRTVLLEDLYAFAP